MITLADYFKLAPKVLKESGATNKEVKLFLLKQLQSMGILKNGVTNAVLDSLTKKNL